MNIGLILIATNKYREFVPLLLEDIHKYFLTNHNVEIFVFSDRSINNVTWIKCEHKPWPWMTLGRYALIKNLPPKDYYYYIDVDSRILNPIGDEILTDRLAVAHCGFKGGKGTHESRPESLAYIPNDVDYTYCHGGFQGGKLYLEDAAKLDELIMKDYTSGIIATWHDESHWNRYLIDNKPSKLLPYTYCCFKYLDLNAKIQYLKKDNKELRSE